MPCLRARRIASATNHSTSTAAMASVWCGRPPTPDPPGNLGQHGRMCGVPRKPFIVRCSYLHSLLNWLSTPHESSPTGPSIRQFLEM